MVSSETPAAPPLTARVIHYLDARHLLTLLPYLDQSDLHEIRNEFARFVDGAARRSPFTSWQEAWNAWTGAHPDRPGQIEYTPARCHTCGGKGWNTRTVSRNLARTGHPAICGDCRGSRRGQRTRQVARYARLPEDRP